MLLLSMNGLVKSLCQNPKISCLLSLLNMPKTGAEIYLLLKLKQSLVNLTFLTFIFCAKAWEEDDKEPRSFGRAT